MLQIKERNPFRTTDKSVLTPTHSQSQTFSNRDQKLYNRNRETHRVMVENSQLEGPVFSSGIKILYFSCSHCRKRSQDRVTRESLRGGHGFQHSVTDK